MTSQLRAALIRALAQSLLIFAAGRAEAICISRDAPVIDNPKSYVSTLLDALVVLKAARDRSTEIKDAAGPMDVIALFETAKREYDCVVSYVAPYEKSSNEAIATSAKGVSLAARSLQRNSEALRHTFNDLIDGKREKQSEQAERAGKLEVEGRDAWHFELNSVVAACLSLIEFGQDQKQRGLVLTAKERTAFLGQIKKHFGNPSSKDNNLPELESSIVVLRKFLADDKTRPSHQE